MANIRAKDLPDSISSFSDNDYFAADEGSSNQTKKVNKAAIKSGLGLAANRKTVISTTNPTPDFVGQPGIDANGKTYVAISLTGTMWEVINKVDNSTIEVSAAGVSNIKNAGVTPSKLAAQIKTIANLLTTAPDYIGQIGVYNDEKYIAVSTTASAIYWRLISSRVTNIKTDHNYLSNIVSRADFTNFINGEDADYSSLYTNEIVDNIYFQGLTKCQKINITPGAAVGGTCRHYVVFDQEYVNDPDFIKTGILNISFELFCPVAGASIRLRIYNRTDAGGLGTQIITQDISLTQNVVNRIDISGVMDTTNTSGIRFYMWNQSAALVGSYLLIGKTIINAGSTPLNLNVSVKQSEMIFTDITDEFTMNSEIFNIGKGNNNIEISDLASSLVNNYNFESGIINRCTAIEDTSGISGWATQSRLGNTGVIDDVIAATGLKNNNYAMRISVPAVRPAGNNLAAYLLNADDLGIQSGDKISVSIMFKTNLEVTIGYDVYKKSNQNAFAGYTALVGANSTNTSTLIPADGDWHRIVVQQKDYGSLDAGSGYVYNGILLWIRDKSTVTVANLMLQIGSIIIQKNQDAPISLNVPFVTSVNDIPGNVVLAAGSNVTLTKVANTLTIASNPTVDLVSRSIKNLFYDSLFELYSENGGSTNIEWLFYDKAIFGTGTIEQQIQPEVLKENYGNSILIKTGASGQNTALSQTIWFWNHDDITINDVLSFSVKVKSNIISSAKFTIEFLDRSESILGSAVSSSLNTVADEFEELKLENNSIPVTLGATTHDGCFGVRVKFLVSQANATVEFSQPMCNLGLSVAPFTPSYQDFNDYKGLERTVESLLSNEDGEIVFLGDSLTHGGDSTQTGIGTSYASKIHDWIESKFNCTITKRNNGCDGSAAPLALAVVEKMGIDHTPKFISVGLGRNVPNVPWSNGTTQQNYELVEGIVRKIKNKSSLIDVLVWMPSYQKLDSEILSTQYIYDREIIRKYNYLVKHYGLGIFYAEEKMRKLANRSLVSWWNWFGGNDASVTQMTHPADIGRTLWLDEFKHIIAGSLRNRFIINFLPTQLNSISELMKSAITIFADEWGIKSGTVKSGTWVGDPNMMSDGTLQGVSGIAYGVGLGEYPQPIVSSAQGDYLQVTWTGQHFAIWFMGMNDRGVAEIDVDGVPYDYNTYHATRVEIVSHPRYATFLSSAQNPGGYSLSNASHTLKITQKNSGTTDKISIAIVLVF